MFNRDPQQCLDELAEEDLAGHRLRGLEHRPDIQLPDGRANGSGGRCRDWCVAQMWMMLLELPHLAIGSPAKIAVAGVLQIHTGNLLEATRRIEAGSEFICEALIGNKAACAGRADRPFVEVHRLNVAAVDAGNLGVDQRGAGFEILRAILRPYFELPLVGGQSLDMLSTPVGGRGIAGRRLAKRTIEVVLRRFKM